MILFLRIILIGTLTYFLSMIMPWWIIALIGAVVGFLIPGGSLVTFMSGFLGVGIVWLGYAWKLDAENDSQFSAIILEIIPLGDNLLLIAVVGVIGGLVGGFSTISGSLLRSRGKKKKSSGYYQ